MIERVSTRRDSTYLRLVKPGMVLGNVITACMGFLVASEGDVCWKRLGFVLAGVAFVVACANILNNYLDRDSDALMSRTWDRPLVKKSIPESYALLLAVLCAVVGFFLLALFANGLTLALVAAALVIYDVFYTPLKYHSAHGVWVGSLSGGVPPAAGYCAVSGAIEWPAVVLFVLMVLWQVPHFLAFSLYRQSDYKAARIPVLPVEKGVRATKVSLFLYVLAFVSATTAAVLWPIPLVSCLAAILCVGTGWLGLSAFGFVCQDEILWAKRMYLASLGVLWVLCVGIVLEFSSRNPLA